MHATIIYSGIKWVGNSIAVEYSNAFILSRSLIFQIKVPIRHLDIVFFPNQPRPNKNNYSMLLSRVRVGIDGNFLKLKKSMVGR
jgi:hypothetical protein